MKLPEYWHVNAKHKSFDFEKFKKVMIENKIQWASGSFFSDLPLDENVCHYVFKYGSLKYSPDEYTKVSAFSEDVTSRFLKGDDLNGWINVKVKMPEKSGNYLCVVDFYITETKIQVLVLCAYFDAKDNQFCSSEFIKNNHKVTHWQPQPQPPREG